MGYYINPPSVTKEQWLKKHGTKDSEDVVRRFWKEGDSTNMLPVCLIDNGWMKAAVIGYTPGETEEFLSPDKRPKT